MTVLVTGANGFVGRHLVAALEAAGHEPKLLGTQPAAFREDVPYRQVDVEDAPALAAAVDAWKPDGCIHLAGLSFVPAADNDPARAFRVNTLGTVHLLDAFQRHAPDARLVMVTSSQVYGFPGTGGPIDETRPLAPQNLYGVTKAAADHAALLFARRYGMAVMTARPNNHIGPGQSPDFVCSAFARQVIAIQSGDARPLIRTGNLESRRDFMDVRDVVRAYLAVLDRGRAGEPYNIATGKLVRIQTLLDELCDLAGVSPIREINQDLFRPTTDGPVLEIARIREHTGWEPRIPLRDSLRDILADTRARNP